MMISKIFFQCYDKVYTVENFLLTYGYVPEQYDTILHIITDDNFVEKAQTVCEMFNIKCQILFTNRENNQFIHYQISNKTLSKNELKYFQGLYLFDTDTFWREYTDMFSKGYRTFEQLINEEELTKLSQKALSDIHEKWSVHQLSITFKFL